MLSPAIGSVPLNKKYKSYPESQTQDTFVFPKHYYMGTQRIVSRVGDGTAAIFHGKSPEPGGLRELQQQDLLYFASKAGIKAIEYAEYKTPDLNELLGDEATKAPAAVTLYFYHPDHLGSNTLLTDMMGKPYQIFLNLPFGEPTEGSSLTPLKNKQWVSKPWLSNLPIQATLYPISLTARS